MLNVSTGIEPNFMLKFKRRTVSLNNEETIYEVEASIVEKYRNITGNKGELPEYFVTSHNIDWIDRIKMQASSQRYIDTAISSTCNLPKGTKPNEVELMYLEAWKHKLKGFTIYVDGCRDSVLFNENSLSIKDVISNYNNAIKRPKTLKAKYFPVKIKGENFAVIMGFIGDEDRPYEIFAIRPDKHYPAHEGEITKVKKLVYKFESNLVTINDITDTNIDTLEKVITLLLSITLRHQIAIKYITHALDKPVDDITSFVSGISRILKQFQDVEELKDKCPECGGKLVNECGCIHCTECGYSKCGD
jgi:ribonucleoside-diphosphate reductase alpha chain